MKKVLSCILVLVLMLTAAPLGGFVGLELPKLTASAATYGDLNYSEYDTYVTITDCNGSATSVEIPSEINGKPVTSIGSNAFKDCSSLQSITIPDSVTSIGNNAFNSCNSLKKMTLPFVGASRTATGYKSVFGYIFGYSTSTSTSLDGILQYYDFGISLRYYYYYIPTSLREVTIIDANSIPNYAFCGCSFLESITIPNSTTSIGGYAFIGCSSLKSITIPNSVISIGNYAFSSCSSLQSVTIPDSVTNIGGFAFYDCSSLQSITIPNSVTSIGSGAFKDTAYYNNESNCEKKELCMGGCPLMPEIVFCNSEKRK